MKMAPIKPSESATVLQMVAQTQFTNSDVTVRVRFTRVIGRKKYSSENIVE